MAAGSGPRRNPGEGGVVEVEAEVHACAVADSPRLVAIAVALTGRRWAAEQLAQDALVSVARDAGDADLYRALVRRAGSPGRVALAALRTRLKRGGRRGFVPDELVGEVEGFWAAVRDLAVDGRIAFVLQAVGGLDAETIAAVRGCTVEDARADLADAERSLRQRFDPDAAILIELVEEP